MNGGKSKPRYGGSSQVNTGSYYSYHSSSTNNNSWLPIVKPKDDKADMEAMEGLKHQEAKPRMGSVASMMSSESSDNDKS